jgi:hypothetical protein
MLGAGRKKFEKIYDGEILTPSKRLPGEILRKRVYSIGQNGITSAKHSE